MSSAPTDCRVPDPSDKLDAKADGQFQAVNRRAGYGDDRLDRIIATARKGWTLAAGEGLVLVQEIDRLREELAQQSITLSAEHQRAERLLAALREQLRDTHTKVFHLEEKLTWVERERDQLTSMPAERILAALRNPSDLMVDALREQIYDLSCFDEALKAIRVAVAAAEKEVGA